MIVRVPFTALSEQITTNYDLKFLLEDKMLHDNEIQKVNYLCKRKIWSHDYNDETCNLC